MLYYGGSPEITMTYPLWAVIAGREYCGEDFHSLKLFTNGEDAEAYVEEINDRNEPDVYVILDRVFVDHGVGG